MSRRVLSGERLVAWCEELVQVRVLPLVHDGLGDVPGLAAVLAECYIMGALDAVHEETDRLRADRRPRPVDGNRPT